MEMPKDQGFNLIQKTICSIARRIFAQCQHDYSYSFILALKLSFWHL
jgi:hypothetical protein